MSKTAILEFDGKKYEFPLIEGTESEVAIDINKLRDVTGAITMDPGYKNSGSCTSKITFLDGDKGILRYRGYSIEELAEKSNFLWCKPQKFLRALRTLRKFNVKFPKGKPTFILSFVLKLPIT